MMKEIAPTGFATMYHFVRRVLFVCLVTSALAGCGNANAPKEALPEPPAPGSEVSDRSTAARDPSVEPSEVEEPSLPEESAPDPGPEPIEVEEPLPEEATASPEPEPSLEAVAARPNTTGGSVAPLFTEALAEVKQETEVPVLLPNKVPAPGDSPLFARADASADRYAIDVGFAPNCRGGACAVGFFGGRQGSGDFYEIDEAFSETVTLANGITGYYNPMQCGASCSPPVLEWEMGGVRYRFSCKVSGRDEEVAREKMVALANEAIAAGAR